MLTILLTSTHLLAFFTTSNIHYAYGKTIWVLLTCKIVEIRVLLISYCASHLCRRPERKGYMLFWNQQTAYVIDSFVINKTITGGGALWVHFFSRYVYSLSILHLARFTHISASNPRLHVFVLALASLQFSFACCALINGYFQSWHILNLRKKDEEKYLPRLTREVETKKWRRHVQAKPGIQLHKK